MGELAPQPGASASARGLVQRAEPLSSGVRGHTHVHASAQQNTIIQAIRDVDMKSHILWL